MDAADRSPHHGLVVSVCCIGAFVGQFDASVVQLALPTLKDTFGVSIDAVRWVAVAYLLAFASCLPVFGKLCDLFDRKRLYLLGFGLFAAASAVCGLADDFATLVGARVMQGMGGALLGANSMTILATVIVPHRRSHAIGLFTAAQAIGISAGPMVGGVLLEWLSWRWVFWMVVPFGLAAMAIGAAVLPRAAAPAAGRRLDVAGALLIVPCLVLAVLVILQVGAWPIASPPMLACAGGAVVLGVLFVRRERRAEWPLVDLALFGSRNYAAGIAGVALAYAVLYGLLFLMSFAYVHGLLNTPLVAGLKMATVPVGVGLLAPVGVMLAARLGAPRLGTVAMAVCLAALGALAFMAFGPDRLVIRLVALTTFGVGLGLFMTPNADATIKAAPEGHVATAGALVNLARVLGSCVGVAAASSVMSWQLQRYRADASILVPGSPVDVPLLEAVESGLLMLSGFALVAAVVSLLRRDAPGSAGSRS